MMTPLLLIGMVCAAITGRPQDVPRGVGDWKAELGNQRARVLVLEKVDAVRVHIPWRRRDATPEKKGIVVIDAASGNPIKNVYRIAVNREYGDLAFEPVSGEGAYLVYFMPFKQTGSPYFPEVSYPPTKDEADPAWVERNGLKTDAWHNLPEARTLQIQARSEWNRPDPMEVIASKAETDRLRDDHPNAPYLIFPEDRLHPIRMNLDLPERWIEHGPSDRFKGDAKRGEFYAFQLGLWGSRAGLENVSLHFNKLIGEGKATLPAAILRCFNQVGTDWLGRKFEKQVSVAKGQVSPLWVGAQIPADAKPGVYHGTITVNAKGLPSRSVAVELNISKDIAADAGDSDPANMTRLRWLDSTVGLDDEVVAPYTSIKAAGSVVECLGRKVQFGSDGFPTSIASNGHELLSHPISISAETGGIDLAWKSATTQVTHRAPAAITHQTESAAGSLTMTCVSKMEADGYINFRVAVTAKSAMKMDDIRLDIPIRREMATFLMGMGRKGGNRPAEWSWDWKKAYANNMVWVGAVDGGLQCKLKGPEESWDLFRLTSIPDAWSNNGHGGCTITEQGKDTVLIRAFSGNRQLKAGQTLHFNFGLLITPVKPLDPAHWSQRYDHEFIAPAKAKQNGATVINVHQGNDLNPNINYPFLHTDAMAKYVKEAHGLGMKVKIYYTVRELSSRLPEIWPLRSLGTEVFTDGPGGGDSWLQEHLVSHYKPAWHTPLADGSVDAAITTVGLSRWHNYYLEGLGWLIKNVGIDGLYLDGIGYDREIMKRVRKVMDRTRPGCLIDYHCGNSFQPEYGMNSCANQFMEHFPYINSLWFGEGYDYNETPDYWLTEISGIPFGLYGEMLQDNGNPWRGMVYGMTARYYSGAEPKPIWTLWDDFGIAKAKMLGYWAPDCPVRTSDPNVLATAYVRNGKTLISFASWNKSATKVKLTLDWKALGLDPAKATFSAPAVKGFQPAATFNPTDEIPVDPAHGWMLIVSN